MMHIVVLKTSADMYVLGVTKAMGQVQRAVGRTQVV